MANKYKIGDVVDLDDVMLSPAAVARWRAIVAAARPAFASVNPADIPEEQGLWLPSGELEIFVEVRGVRVSQKVPASEWVWSDPTWRN